LRQNSGTPNKIYCDVSADGVTWSNTWPTTGTAATAGSPIQRASAEWVSLSGGTISTAVAAPGTAKFTNFALDGVGYSFTSNLQSGDAGTVACIATAQKTVTCNLSAYTCVLGSTGCTAAQTWTFPVPFATMPILQMNSAASAGHCGVYDASVTAAAITFPANAAMVPETCSIVVTGP
jgi:hypothetical protein